MATMTREDKRRRDKKIVRNVKKEKCAFCFSEETLVVLNKIVAGIKEAQPNALRMHTRTFALTTMIHQIALDIEAGDLDYATLFAVEIPPTRTVVTLVAR